jgi:hypothetical protein
MAALFLLLNQVNQELHRIVTVRFPDCGETGDVGDVVDFKQMLCALIAHNVVTDTFHTTILLIAASNSETAGSGAKLHRPAGQAVINRSEVGESKKEIHR